MASMPERSTFQRNGRVKSPAGVAHPSNPEMVRWRMASPGKAHPTGGAI